LHPGVGSSSAPTGHARDEGWSKERGDVHGTTKGGSWDPIFPLRRGRKNPFFVLAKREAWGTGKERLLS